MRAPALVTATTSHAVNFFFSIPLDALLTALMWLDSHGIVIYHQIRSLFPFRHFISPAAFLESEKPHIRVQPMKKDDAIAIMHHLAGKLEHVLTVEDLVSPFAEFMAHIESDVTEEDFAFLATVGAMIYLKGSRHYDSSVQTSLLLEKIRK
jgi:hypothetical protein